MLWLVALFVMVFSSLPYVFLVMALITMVSSSTTFLHVFAQGIASDEMHICTNAL
jgi:hypothetical protein